MDAVIELVGVLKVFRDFWLRPTVAAVDGLSMSVRRGEVFGLLGPNGSGKSTTIKMILGLLGPTAGKVALFVAFVALIVGEMGPSVVEQYPDGLETNPVDRIGLCITRFATEVTRPVSSLQAGGVTTR